MILLREAGPIMFPSVSIWLDPSNHLRYLHQLEGPLLKWTNINSFLFVHLFLHLGNEFYSKTLTTWEENSENTKEVLIKFFAKPIVRTPICPENFS